MPKPTRQDLHEDARLLREEIDRTWERLADQFSETQAEESTKPLYNAVTRLHEWAVDGLDQERRNQTESLLAENPAPVMYTVCTLYRGESCETYVAVVECSLTEADEK